MENRDILLAHGLEGKTALVTGASSGLGARFAHVLAAAGARVVIVARRLERLEELQKQIENTGAEVIAQEFDVNNISEIEAFYQNLEKQGWMPDILVNNAGMNVVGTALDLSVEDYQTIISTNMSAPFFLAREFARHHIAAGNPARIINIASVGAREVLPGITPYCMSKSGILMMTRGLAREWARHEINVNAICPGYIETEINDFWWQTEGGKKQISGFPRRRLAGQEDLDGALLLLSGVQGKGMTGTSITVDDGQYI